MTDSTAHGTQTGGEQWLGHPRGLFYLFFAEMWERFCFYGMRNILVLYMVKYFGYSDEEAQGGVYAAYASLVYCSAIFGGLVADRFLGYRKSIIFGGAVMAVGMLIFTTNRESAGFVGISLSEELERIFCFGGMATIIVGNGFFKPNISTMVGKLYAIGDRRRDAGFTIFYMGINVGAFAGGLACAEIGQRVSWPLGFGLAAIGMLLGVLTFGSGPATRSLEGHGEPPSPDTARRALPIVIIASLAAIPALYFLLQRSDLVAWLLGITAAVVVGTFVVVAAKETQVQRERIFAMLVLVLFNPVFWAFFEQAGTSLTLFADRNLDRNLLGWEMGSGTVQNLNSVFIILLAPLLTILWLRLGRAGKEPSIPAKFALGLFQLGLGFVFLVIGARLFATDGITPLVFMVGLYLLVTTGELCLSPIGLSMITKLAPPRMTGMAMGAWFLSVASANFLAGQIGALTGAAGGEAGVEGDVSPTESIGIYAEIYTNSAYFIFGAAVLLLLLVPLLKKWMHGIK